MRKGQMRPVAGLVLVLGMLLGGFWVPASAEELAGTAATPVASDEAPGVAPVEPGEETGEAPEGDSGETPDASEEPAESPEATEEDAEGSPETTGETPEPAPRRVAPATVENRVLAAASSLNITKTASAEVVERGDTVTYTITAWGTSSYDVVDVWDWLPWEVRDVSNVTCEIITGTAIDDPCAAYDGTVWIDGAVAPDEDGDFRMVVSYSVVVDTGPNAWFENEACVSDDDYEVCAYALVSTPVEEVATVTINAILPPGASFPASGMICVWDEVNWEQCAEGQNLATFAVGATAFEYMVDAHGYGWVFGDGEVAEGESTTIDVELVPQDFNITKTVSDPNPAPGAEVTYTIHAWGTAPSGLFSFWDDMSWRMTLVGATCEFATGSMEWPESCEEWAGEGWYSWFGADILPAEDGSFDFTVTLVATAPDEPGVRADNIACITDGRGGERETVASVAADPIIGSECAAATLVTQGETEDASVIINVTTEDGSPVPAGTAICVVTPVAPNPDCAASGSTSGSFTVAAGPFESYVAAPGYGFVSTSGELEAGEERVIDVVLARSTMTDMEVIKTVSNPEPLPGERVTYQISVSGTTPGSYGYVQFVDLLPVELSNARVDCETIIGWAWEMTCAYPQNGMIVGGLESTWEGEYEMLVTVTGTVPDEPGVTFTNLACAMVSEDDDYVPTPTSAVTRTGVQAFAQRMSLMEGACDAATVTTLAEPEPEPEPGTWGLAAMTVDVTEAAPGDTVTFTVTLPWAAAQETVALLSTQGFAQAVPEPTFRIRDLVPDLLTDVSWTCVGENATCTPPSGTDTFITAEGAVLDPAQDALITLTITGTVVPEAEDGQQIVNQACITHQAGAPLLAFQQVPCDQDLVAVVLVVVQPVDPATPTPTAPVEPGTPTPATPAPTATPAGTPAVTVLPSTGAAPGPPAASLALLALAAAAMLGGGAFAIRGALRRQ